jgi:hypothetical protein
MRQMGYSSCKADPDLWLKAVTRPDDNVRYYAYILCYVDDILCIHHDPMSVKTGHRYLKQLQVARCAATNNLPLRRFKAPLENTYSLLPFVLTHRKLSTPHFHSLPNEALV